MVDTGVVQVATSSPPAEFIKANILPHRAPQDFAIERPYRHVELNTTFPPLRTSDPNPECRNVERSPATSTHGLVSLASAY